MQFKTKNDKDRDMNTQDDMQIGNVYEQEAIHISDNFILIHQHIAYALDHKGPMTQE